MRLFSLLVVFVLVENASAIEFPEVPVPAEWFRCAEDADCAVAGDSCRSCGEVTIINKKFLSDYLALDDSIREKAGVRAKCEACSPDGVIFRCVAGNCAQGQRTP